MLVTTRQPLIIPICYFVIASDNINKIPRDLKRVGPNQKEFVTTRPTFDDVSDDTVISNGVTISQAESQLANNFMITPSVEDFLMDQIDAARETAYQGLLNTWFAGKKDFNYRKC